MAITLIQAGRVYSYIGLSGDVKPTNVGAGSLFYETDTGNTYQFDGTATWNLLTAPGIGGGTSLLGKVSAIDETSTVYNGTTALTPTFAAIAVASSGNNNLVAAVTSKRIRVLAYNLSASGTVNAKFQTDGAGTPVDLTGLKYFVANSGIVAPYNPKGWLQSASGKTLDLNLSGNVAVGGELLYIAV